MMKKRGNRIRAAAILTVPLVNGLRLDGTQQEALRGREVAQAIAARFDEAQALVAAHDASPRNVHKAVRLLEMNLRRWGDLEPLLKRWRAENVSATGETGADASSTHRKGDDEGLTQVYTETSALLARNQAALGETLARIDRPGDAITHLEQACPAIWEHCGGRGSSSGSSSTNDVESGSGAGSGDGASKDGASSGSDNASARDSDGGIAGIDGCGSNGFHSWATCNARLAELYRVEGRQAKAAALERRVAERVGELRASATAGAVATAASKSGSGEALLAQERDAGNASRYAGESRASVEECAPPSSAGAAASNESTDAVETVAAAGAAVVTAAESKSQAFELISRLASLSMDISAGGNGAAGGAKSGGGGRGLAGGKAAGAKDFASAAGVDGATTAAGVATTSEPSPADSMRRRMNEVVRELAVATVTSGRTHDAPARLVAQAEAVITDVRSGRLYDGFLASGRSSGGSGAGGVASSGSDGGGAAVGTSGAVLATAAAGRVSPAVHREVLKEASHFLSVIRGISSSGWGYLDREIARLEARAAGVRGAAAAASAPRAAAAAAAVAPPPAATTSVSASGSVHAATAASVAGTAMAVAAVPGFLTRLEVAGLARRLFAEAQQYAAGSSRSESTREKRGGSGRRRNGGRNRSGGAADGGAGTPAGDDGGIGAAVRGLMLVCITTVAGAFISGFVGGSSGPLGCIGGGGGSRRLRGRQAAATKAAKTVGAYEGPLSPRAATVARISGGLSAVRQSTAALSARALDAGTAASAAGLNFMRAQLARAASWAAERRAATPAAPTSGGGAATTAAAATAVLSGGGGTAAGPGRTKVTGKLGGKQRSVRQGGVRSSTPPLTPKDEVFAALPHAADIAVAGPVQPHSWLEALPPQQQREMPSAPVSEQVPTAPEPAQPLDVLHPEPATAPKVMASTTRFAGNGAPESASGVTAAPAATATLRSDDAVAVVSASATTVAAPDAGAAADVAASAEDRPTSPAPESRPEALPEQQQSIEEEDGDSAASAAAAVLLAASAQVAVDKATAELASDDAAEPAAAAAAAAEVAVSEEAALSVEAAVTDPSPASAIAAVVAEDVATAPAPLASSAAPAADTKSAKRPISLQPPAAASTEGSAAAAAAASETKPAAAAAAALPEPGQESQPVAAIAATAPIMPPDLSIYGAAADELPSELLQALLLEDQVSWNEAIAATSPADGVDDGWNEVRARPRGVRRSARAGNGAIAGDSPESPPLSKRGGGSSGGGSGGGSSALGAGSAAGSASPPSGGHTMARWPTVSVVRTAGRASAVPARGGIGTSDGGVGASSTGGMYVDIAPPVGPSGAASLSPVEPALWTKAAAAALTPVSSEARLPAISGDIRMSRQTNGIIRGGAAGGANGSGLEPRPLRQRLLPQMQTAAKAAGFVKAERGGSARGGSAFAVSSDNSPSSFGDGGGKMLHVVRAPWGSGELEGRWSSSSSPAGVGNGAGAGYPNSEGGVTGTGTGAVGVGTAAGGFGRACARREAGVGSGRPGREQMVAMGSESAEAEAFPCQVHAPVPQATYHQQLQPHQPMLQPQQQQPGMHQQQQGMQRPFHSQRQPLQRYGTPPSQEQQLQQQFSPMQRQLQSHRQYQTQQKPHLPVAQQPQHAYPQARCQEHPPLQEMQQMQQERERQQPQHLESTQHRWGTPSPQPAPEEQRYVPVAEPAPLVPVVVMPAAATALPPQAYLAATPTVLAVAPATAPVLVSQASALAMPAPLGLMPVLVPDNSMGSVSYSSGGQSPHAFGGSSSRGGSGGVGGTDGIGAGAPIADVHAALRWQVEYYFSAENLCKDLYLRGKMDANGFVPLPVIMAFNRIRAVTCSAVTLYEALLPSQKLELSLPAFGGNATAAATGIVTGGGGGSEEVAVAEASFMPDPISVVRCRIRTRETDPLQWLLPPPECVPEASAGLPIAAAQHASP